MRRLVAALLIALGALLGTLAAPRGATAQHTAFVPQTGHSLGGVFRAYWERNGGLARFGYPISEEFALFLEFLAKTALAHPEELVNVADLTAGDEDLFAGVELDE